MSEGWVVVAFLLLMGLRVPRIVREQRELVASDSHLSLRGGRKGDLFRFRRQHRRV